MAVKYETLFQRLLAHAPPFDLNDPNECWEHDGNLSRAGGYPRLAIWRKGKHVKEYAHRLMWQECHGPVPEGYEVDHMCHNHRCIRESHLQLLTVAENRSINQSIPPEEIRQMTTTEIVDTVAAGMRKLTNNHAAELKALKAQHATQIKAERDLHAATVKQLVAEWEEETAALRKRVKSAELRAKNLTAQRDEAKGRANEYRGYANKYQRELIELKKEMRNA